jgi:hypothetical protein
VFQQLNATMVKNLRTEIVKTFAIQDISIMNLYVYLVNALMVTNIMDLVDVSEVQMLLLVNAKIHNLNKMENVFLNVALDSILILLMVSALNAQTTVLHASIIIIV